MKSKAFFCEACGKPVGLKDTKCPHCGRLFDSVRCPKCDFSGRHDLFSNGCPACGYLRDSRSGASTKDAFPEIERGLVTPESDGIEMRGIRASGGSLGSGEKKREGRLPPWAYGLLSIVLVLLLIGIFIVYIRL